MDFLIAADTDIGNTRKTNQDSVAVLVADTSFGPVSFGVICDGMGGLAKGELASATLLNAMVNWFKNDFKNYFSGAVDDGIIREQWIEIIRKNNELIKEYGKVNGINLGTTVSAILLTQERYYVVNVGDSRIYEIFNGVNQITEDQTVVAQELKYGRLTPEQARNDPRNSVLLQCVGASQTVSPDFFFGSTLQNATYMLCSDGFRHVISDDEIYNSFSPDSIFDANIAQSNIRQLIDINKQRMEKDNITAAIIRTF